MDIFVLGIPPDLKEDDVLALDHAVSNHLHNNALLRLLQPSGLPINFKVDLFKHARSRRNNGKGKISIPNEAVAQGFLNITKGRLQIDRNRDRVSLKIQPAREPITTETIDELIATAYEPPFIRKMRLGHAAKLAEPVPVETIEIGFQCRKKAPQFPNGVFSVEWQRNTPIGRAKFDDFNNHLKLFLWPDGPHAVIKPASTEIFIVDVFSRKAYFFMSEAPSFEHSGAEEDFEWEENQDGDDPLRIRLPAFDDAHEIIAPYISRCFRISFNKEEQLNHFILSCKEIGFQEPSKQAMPVAFHLSLYSNEQLEKLNRWWQDKLPYEVTYQLDMLLSNGILHPEEILSLRGDIDAAVLNPGKEAVALALTVLGANEDRTRFQPPNYRHEDLAKVFREILASQLTPAVTNFRRRARKADPDKVLLHHVTYTPTGRYLEGPTMEQSNRVLRRYGKAQAANFLRVTFADEDRLMYRKDRDVDSSQFLYNRFGFILKNGFWLGGREFLFLAYSNSALREHTVYFVTRFYNPGTGWEDAHTIRRSLGKFDKELFHPARLGARMSQAFSSTEKSITLEEYEVVREGDVERNDYCFTDGVGAMSKEIAKAIGNSLRNKFNKPDKELASLEACQMRIGGAKGMIAVSSRLRGRIVILRPSQLKFESRDLDVEICSIFTKPLPYYLNRPLIKILEDLGVLGDVFMEMQNKEVKFVRAAERKLLDAALLFERRGFGRAFRLPYLFRQLSNFLKLEIGPGQLEDDFLSLTISMGIHSVLRELKHKARIYVQNGWTLAGIADEYQCLPPGCIYARIEQKDKGPTCLEGPIGVSRSPNLDTGAFQLVTAMSDAELEQMGRKSPDWRYPPNVVVFSVLGERPLPSMLSGGDLDGDLYNLLFDPHLMPQASAPAAEYPASPIKRLPHPCTIEDVADFVIDFIQNDVTALVSTLHLQMADECPEGTASEECMLLAQWHSRAVDFQKSGYPVDSSLFPRPSERRRPDFLSPEGATVAQLERKYYPSQRVLGQLFRSIAIDLPRDRKGTHRLNRFEVGGGNLAEPRVPRRNAMVVIQGAIAKALKDRKVNCTPGPEDYKAADKLFTSYANEMNMICVNHALSRRFDAALTEEEAFIGMIQNSDVARKRKRDVISAMNEQCENLSDNVLDLLAEEKPERWLERSYATWKMACDKGQTFGARSLSWLALSSLIAAIKQRVGLYDERDRDGGLFDTGYSMPGR